MAKRSSKYKSISVCWEEPARGEFREREGDLSLEVYQRQLPGRGPKMHLRNVPVGLGIIR